MIDLHWCESVYLNTQTVEQERESRLYLSNLYTKYRMRWYVLNVWPIWNGHRPIPNWVICLRTLQIKLKVWDQQHHILPVYVILRFFVVFLCGFLIINVTVGCNYSINFRKIRAATDGYVGIDIWRVIY